MARIVNFNQQPQRQPLGGNLERSQIIKEILRRQQRQQRPQIQSIGEGFLRLGEDAFNAWGAKHEGVKQAQEARGEIMRNEVLQEFEQGQQLEAAEEFGQSVFGDKPLSERLEANTGSGNQGSPLKIPSNIPRLPSNDGNAFPTQGNAAFNAPNAGVLPEQGNATSNQANGQFPLTQRLEASTGGNQRPPLQIPSDIPRIQQQGNPRLDQFNSLLKIDPGGAVNWAMQNDPRRQQSGSMFAKPNVKDFTPESVRSFQQSRNPGDLVRVPPGPSSQITAALIPTILGGINYDDPAELIRGLQAVQGASAALSGGDQAKLNEILTIIQQNQTAATPEQPDEPGMLSKGFNFAKEQGTNLKNFLMGQFENGIPEPQVVQEYFSSNKQPGSDERKLSDRLESLTRQSLPKSPFSALHDLGEQYLLPAYRKQQSPGQAPVMNQQGEGGITAEDWEIFNDFPDALIDEEGYFFKPNRNAPDGKQFVRDGQKRKVRSSRF